MREYLLTLLVTAAVTYLLTPLVRRGAIRAGGMHEARDRDVHVVPIPRMGGLAMFFGLAGGLYVADRVTPLNSVLAGTGMAQGLLLAGGLIVVMGIVDDRWGMNAISKLAGQVAAGGILVASGTELTWLPWPGSSTFSLDPDQATVLTILVVVATINAVNFIDGLDGLAAGITAIAALSFFIYYYTLTKELRLSAEATPALASAILAGMCLGFLPHNFYPARIFMGDTGSMLLGLLLAYAPISSITSLDYKTVTGEVNRFPEILPLLLPTLIMVIPYADLLMAVIRRTRAGKPFWAPDRKHLHHRLLDIGHSHRQSVVIMYLWAAVFSALVVWFSTARTPLFVFAVITVVAVLTLLLMSMPRLRWWQRGRVPRRAPAPAPAQAPAPALVPAAPIRVTVPPGPPAAPAGDAPAGDAPARHASAGDAPSGDAPSGHAPSGDGPAARSVYDLPITWPARPSAARRGHRGTPDDPLGPDFPAGAGFSAGATVPPSPASPPSPLFPVVSPGPAAPSAPSSPLFPVVSPGPGSPSVAVGGPAPARPAPAERLVGPRPAPSPAPVPWDDPWNTPGNPGNGQVNGAQPGPWAVAPAGGSPAPSSRSVVGSIPPAVPLRGRPPLGPPAASGPVPPARLLPPYLGPGDEASPETMPMPASDDDRPPY